MRVGIMPWAVAALCAGLTMFSAPAAAQQCEPDKLYEVKVHTALELEKVLNFMQPQLPYDVHGFRHEGRGFQLWVTARCTRRERHVYKVKYSEFHKDTMTLQMRIGTAAPLSIHRDRGSDATCIWYAYDQTQGENPELAMVVDEPAAASAAAAPRCSSPR